MTISETRVAVLAQRLPLFLSLHSFRSWLGSAEKGISMSSVLMSDCSL